MLTEFGGKPVAGGTLPAQIWKAFMTAADEAARDRRPSSSRRRRTSRLRRSASSGATARTSSTTATARVRASSRTSSTAGPATQAKCYANEVTVPLVVGKTVDAANETLAEQPLGSELIGVPAKAGKRPGYVIKQEPRNGFLSANDTVRLYVTRPDPRYGLLPNLVGSSVTVAKSRLRRIKARTTITYDAGA